jgi:hypothetical protein
MTRPNVDLGRAFLERAVKVASDPDADTHERAYAQQVVAAVKSANDKHLGQVFAQLRK